MISESLLFDSSGKKESDTTSFVDNLIRFPHHNLPTIHNIANHLVDLWTTQHEKTNCHATCVKYVKDTNTSEKYRIYVLGKVGYDTVLHTVVADNHGTIVSDTFRGPRKLDLEKNIYTFFRESQEVRYDVLGSISVARLTKHIAKMAGKE